ncbi:Dual specificity mitogen-activated protein kinase kinase 7 [Armadillidium vulgare]|nr:Dual specificity mitogen-activated protein kinase kinase 7 [Armadillidium vulgare]
MATLSSFKDSLQGLGNRLKAENEAQSRDRMNTNLNLDFSRERPGSERRPKPLPFPDFQIPGRPNTISARPRGERPRIEPLLFQAPKQNQDSPELNAHVKEISRKKGIITINSKKYKSTIDDMKYISELGNGTSGSVVKMLHTPSEKFIAVKQMHRSGNLEEAKRVFFDLEVVLNSHDCPYIVQCLGCFVTDTDVWICMELMATCLDKLMKKYKQPFPEPIIGKIAVGVSITVKALHYLKESHGVIHRDVKPSNILLDEKGNIKLCDFGISGRLVESKANTRSAGCAAYMAPERIDPPDASKPEYDIRADVWSLGITLVELATGQFPYKDCRTDFEFYKMLHHSTPDKTFSQEFREFVNDCLVKDYKHRPKYKKLLEYPFIKKYEKEKVDVSKWFKEVTRTIESRSKTWPQTVFSSPQFPRPSRAGTRAPSSVPTNETPPTPPPVAPRRRSRTPDTRSQDKFGQLPHPQRPPQQPPPPPPHPNKAIVSSSNSQLPSQNDQVRAQVPPSSPTSTRAVSSSPARNASTLNSPSHSRALSSSPIPRGPVNDSVPPSHSPFLSSHITGSIPHHQYGVPSSSSTSYSHHSYSAKPYYSQGYTQYCNPYSQALPPRGHTTTSSTSSTSTSHFSTSGSLNTNNIGDSSVNSSNSPHRLQHHHHHQNRFYPSSSTANSSSPTTSASNTFSHPTPPSSSSSSSSTSSFTPQILRKTPEPVRFNPEPWAPRGRFTQPAHHHFRSLSHDFSSSNSSSPMTVRYTQEAYYNSRPYYTPELQRRVFPRLGHP